MVELSYEVVRVLSSNAVLARHGEDELVLVGRGIGFGRSVGELIPAGAGQQEFIAAQSDKAQYLNLVNSIDAEMFETISAAVDLAADLLGELHPSVYLLLTDHLVFAVARQREGQAILNPLLGEIRAVFPAEFGAAELVLQYINSRLGIDLPIDEAAFITLHLNAARHGSNVKQPLQQANALAGINEYVYARLGRVPATGAVHDDFVLAMARLGRRLRRGDYRHNQAARSIQRDLPFETELAGQLIQRLLDVDRLPREAAGEVATLAVLLHGWRQDLDRATPPNS